MRAGAEKEEQVEKEAAFQVGRRRVVFQRSASSRGRLRYR